MALFKPVELRELNDLGKNTMAEALGIEITEIGEDFLSGRMPVDERTRQPFGLLHGGASVALAETLGSLAGTLVLDREREACVGLEINANHIRSARNGFVHGTARPVHIGSSTQVWEIRIKDDRDKLVCLSRLTLAVVKRRERTAT
jgi:1,4-dihydroxy-2-naphthoyl-CoA hydrolase